MVTMTPVIFRRSALTIDLIIPAEVFHIFTQCVKSAAQDTCQNQILEHISTSLYLVVSRC